MLNDLPTATQLNDYVRLMPLLEAAYKEVAEQNKKKPEESLSPLRLERINFVLGPLTQIFELVVEPHFLGTFDPSVPPSNSDALFVLGQYLGAASAFKTQFHFSPKDESTRLARWVTRENPGTRRRDNRGE